MKPHHLLLAFALVLAACEPKNPAAPPAGPSAPPAPGPGQPPAPPVDPGEPVGDGGAEQAPDEPLPPPDGGAPIDAPSPPGPHAVTFEHNPAGALIPGSGSGYLDRTIWAPGMCFPMAGGGYANSQVYNPGGGMGPAGKPSQCDPTNYSLPWRDNFCESRGYASPLCANGKGHQGQDIRPASCAKNQHWVVATEDGVITQISSYTVTLVASAPPHRKYRFLHMQMSALPVAEGAVVHKGDHIGKTSNFFGGTPTTIHMHFEMRAGVSGVSTDGKPVVVSTFLPPYLSLVDAYERQLSGGGLPVGVFSLAARNGWLRSAGWTMAQRLASAWSSTMAFTVSGLSPAAFQHLVGRSDQDLAAQGARRVIADGPGYPDRIELRDAAPGEPVLLVNYTHQPADTPFRASHAIYVLERATQAQVFKDALPPALARRLLSLRAFDAGHMMIDAEVVEGARAGDEIERMLGDAQVAYIHAHYARQGCYAALIERR